MWEGGVLPEKTLECKERTGTSSRAPGWGCLGSPGGGDIFPAISGTVGPPGPQGTHSRHHLLALGSGLNRLELSQVPRLGVLEPLLGPRGLGCQPLARHQHPGCRAGPSPVLGAEVQREVELSSARSHLGAGKPSFQTLARMLGSRTSPSVCVLVCKTGVRTAPPPWGDCEGERFPCT